MPDLHLYTHTRNSLHDLLACWCVLPFWPVRDMDKEMQVRCFWLSGSRLTIRFNLHRYIPSLCVQLALNTFKETDLPSFSHPTVAASYKVASNKVSPIISVACQGLWESLTLKFESGISLESLLLMSYLHSQVGTAKKKQFQMQFYPALLHPSIQTIGLKFFKSLRRCAALVLWRWHCEWNNLLSI